MSFGLKSLLSASTYEALCTFNVRQEVSDFYVHECTRRPAIVDQRELSIETFCITTFRAIVNWGYFLNRKIVLCLSVTLEAATFCFAQIVETGQQANLAST